MRSETSGACLAVACVPLALALCTFASLSARSESRDVDLTVRAAAQAATPQVARPPRTDNLVALEMGGRVENQPSRPGALGFVPERALDGDPTTMWAELFPPASIVLSFIGHDTALVASVSITSPSAGSPPPYGVTVTAARPRAVEISLSTTSPTTGFVKAISAPLPDDDGEHAVRLPAPTEARFIKLTFPPPTASSYGKNGVVVGEIAVHEGARAGYIPLLQRHPDLQTLLSTGTLKPDAASLSYQAPGAAIGSSCVAPSVAPAECPESKSVLVVANAPTQYYPLNEATNPSPAPTVRYFGPGPGKGLVDESIYKRVNYWLLQPDLLRPADFLPSAHVDTAVLEQVCDIKTSVSAAVKQALVAWVANGNKLIISDADSCGPGQVPDYSFLPYSFATSNPGGRAAAAALQIVEKSFLVSPESHDPAFFDEPSWRLKKNGNISNDFGDSNTVIKYDDHWCGALFGTNAIGASGFVMAYAHYGHGVIIYDGIDRDQGADLAYHQYLARQLLLPFRPDPLPCSLRVAPFAITTDLELVERHVKAGETVTYPLTVLAAKPDYAGTVALSVAPTAGAPGLADHIDPATVTLGAKGTATLTLTAPAAITAPIAFAVNGTAAGAAGTLCLTIDTARSGHLAVTADLGTAAPAMSRKNLLIILDLSGSMNEALGKSTRIATARTVLHRVLAKVPDDFNVGLRVYGDRYGSKDKETCTDSHLVQPVGKIDRPALLKLIDGAKPRGETPLVYSVLQAIADLKSAGGGSVVLITDGEESCGGDFVAAAMAIKQSGLDFRLNIVGFTLQGQQAQKALGSLATAAGGAYYSAQNGPALSQALAAATITTFPFSIKNGAGKV
ncbi:MAG TPA: VWA domain-containing protein, partial [Vicinamibacterales bacterium]|nr:VWA domain-containing protein [Vicinamibacterales bacterium]